MFGKISTFVSLLFVIVVGGASGGAIAAADVPSTHGMLVFGDSAIYVSHLPMFHAPHNRQVILKIAFSPVAGSNAIAAFVGAKGEGKTLFTLEPEVMDLQPIVNGTRTQFTADIYDGHFEQGGKSLGKLKVLIDQIVFAVKLDPHTPLQNEEKYMVFGVGGQHFAAHIIQGRPSFDAILKVSEPYVLTGSTKTVIPDERLPLFLVGSRDPQCLIGKSLGFPSEARADVKSVAYYEEGDLSH